jgi:hypothetical protein
MKLPMRNVFRLFIAFSVFCTSAYAAIDPSPRKCSSDTLSHLLTNYYADKKLVVVERYYIGEEGGIESFGIKLLPEETYVSHYVLDQKVHLILKVKDNAFMKQRIFVYDAFSNLVDVRTLDSRIITKVPLEPNQKLEGEYQDGETLVRHVSTLVNSVREHRILVYNLKGELLETRTPDSNLILKRGQEM